MNFNNCKRKCISCTSVHVGRVDSIKAKTLFILFDDFFYPAEKEEIMFGKKVEIGSHICMDENGKLKSCKFIWN